ncbi:Semialdehyde dehydrogenase, NAD-binding protein [Corchorus capsularis]|uniref:Probable N-acetyl-gamma-glutamyl-phosphate reductase, chloroplastic n=1 Tax=Corchorus capsularis TaxID=210143 RepID=A0A1R3HV13_COCAP|nr:Semialdehyde dehydrogenase, NAD-binding protein [Corchorus capsularis]
MLRDFKFLRRNSSKNEEIENVPINPGDSLASQPSSDGSTRPPLNTIQDPMAAKTEAEGSTRSRIDRTPTKPKPKVPDSTLHFKTPDKHGFLSKNRFGWAKNEGAESDFRSGGLTNMTPRVSRGVGRANSSYYSESNSTQSTPTKSVSKPPASGFRNKFDGNGGVRGGNFSALYKGVPGSSCGPPTVVNTVEVPHFDLKEDPSFWMDHNVQVLIRVRPLNGSEKSTQGYNRCLKQESSQSITWIGQPEARFTFDHVACEAIDQEILFRMAGLPMVENCLSGYNSCMFAYGQTGSGKTYTMLGEIDDLEAKPSPRRGMTPRIFEFLFARIQAEEEIRRDEKLKYNCKCSFLEIYNEQITDLLDPSATNLLLREDVKKGVYVENLSEFEVQTVSDILKLLTQGSLNRKVAATNMNRESSRSHSVFTCVIESRWEKDSTTNLRFARLNLVDLAGSERQKTSGAEGERLKEAASINKSLSTLGHVIMILVDVANGKPRHVPYRDSKLTFLLQDSLGGNSKTMIIANVSPSICCATETLNTLKFAQRAKLIQNNAVVNEDSTGDVIALQNQIRLLKEELSLLRRQNVSRSLSFGSTISGTMQLEDNPLNDNTDEMGLQQVDDLLGYESKGIVRLSTKQLKSLETTLAGTLRREKMEETCIKKLEAEIEQLNRLVRQREEDNRNTKMMLRLREDKIQRMESLVRGSLPADSFLFEENKALSEEIQLLQAKLDKNPEVTRFALENIRLLDQLRRYQEFYEEGEKEILLEEISNLRDQLLQLVDGNSKQHSYPSSNDTLQDTVCISKEENNSMQLKLKSTLSELEECRHNLNSCLEENAKLSREINDLHTMLNSLKSSGCHQAGNTRTLKGFDQNGGLKEINGIQAIATAEQIMDLQLELDILKIILQEEKASHCEVEQRANCLTRDLEMAKDKLLLLSNQVEDANSELKEAKLVIEALESQQILSINEIEDLRKNNSHFVKLLSEQEVEIDTLKKQLSSNAFRDHPRPKKIEGRDSILQLKLNRMHESLEKAKKMNMWYQSDRAFQASNEEEMDEIRQQVEGETAEVIVCLQEELAILQQEVQDCHSKEMEAQKGATILEMELKELQEKVNILTEDNKELVERLEMKDGELRTLLDEWELLAAEIENILADGHEELDDATDQLNLISSSFPQKRIWISEQVGRVVRILSEKELLIEELGRCLEDATDKRSELECRLESLRDATLAINELQQQECNEKEKEIVLLKSELNSKTSVMKRLEKRMKKAEDELINASVCATAAFVIVNRLSEANVNHLNSLKDKDIRLAESAKMILSKDAILIDQATMIEIAENHIQSLKTQVAKSEQACAELEQRRLEEEQYAAAMKQKLEDIEDNDILKAQEKLSELKTGVSTLRAHMGMKKDCDRSPERSVRQRLYSLDDRSDERRSGKDDKDLHSGQELDTDTPHCSFKVGESLHGSSCHKKFKESGETCKNLCDKEVTVILLKRELESAMESLKEVQAEISRICSEKEEIRLSEEKSKESLRCLATHVLALEATTRDLGKLLELKIGAVNNKVSTFEQTMQEIRTHWCQTKEFLELEVGDAKIIATQKAAEASCVLAKFVEAQDTITEADIMINGLMIANETMKLDMKRQKQVEAALVNERDALIDQVQSLQSINIVKDQQLEDLKEQFGTSLTETRYVVAELEGLVTELQTAFSQNILAVACDCHFLKSLLFDSVKLARSWLEDVWSEIIVKDCAMSVLHLCHTGILLETLTGLNAENGLLQHGLSESNAIMADLREHNSKSRRELEMCRVIKGKLLADIKNSFDRISKKEEETGELSVKLITFEKKISDLQSQEEVMLQRSNYMGSQLTVLMKELDMTNTNFIASLLDQEQLLKDKEELLESQAEVSMVDLCTKDFESLILASEMLQLVARLADSKKELTDAYAVLDSLRRDVIFSKLDEYLKEQLVVECEYESSLLQEKVEEGQGELRKLKEENCQLLRDLDEKKSNLESSVSCLDASNLEIHQLKEKTFSLEAMIASLQAEIELKAVELKELQHSQSVIAEDLGLKSHDLQISVERVNTLREENALLGKKLRSLEGNNLKAHNKSSLNAAKCVDSVETLDMMCSKLFSILNKSGGTIIDRMLQELQDNAERISKFIEEFEHLEHHAKELESENVSLQAELSRKDEVLKGLLFDLSLLQESASNTKDQKDEIEEIVSSLEALEEEVAIKSRELDEAVSHSQMLEVQLQEKLDIISNLQLGISNERKSLKHICSENQKLRAHNEDALAVKSSLEDELRERMKINESLEAELSEMSSAISQMNDTIESLSSSLDEVAGERDQLHMEVLSLEEKLGKTQAEAKQSEAIAMEAQQMAESRKTYAEDKEAEVKLLERSVEELECTVNVLENKVDIIKGEAERQRLQREELELELDALKNQMQNVKNADADRKSCIDEQRKDLQQALDHIQILERDIADKDKEIAQCKTHISELNLHAEAQAKEYKQKFKALEAMADQVKPEGYFTHAQSHSSNKLEKNASKSRGSGSPFKCIGLGLAQQIKSEKDEDLTAARLRIEELESLAANRQKEIFALNARLAATDSMTHDVIRDLLGVKLDMTNYASVLNNQQVQKITEKARLSSLESQVKEHDIVKLKQQLDEFVAERQGWLEEIDKKQAELVAAEVALEKLRQRDQLLKTENEMLKLENVNYKKKVMQLEGEVKKLSGQQNLQQRIHHHAKIKEENNMLKVQNEDLSAKLRRSEVVLSRVREELAHYRASIGKNPHINIDEEQRLNNRLRESNDDRVQLAQKLLGLCTSVLKAAGITKPISDICPAAAEEALEQLKNKVISLERELQTLTLKSKITSERNRLSELMPQTSPGDVKISKLKNRDGKLRLNAGGGASALSIKCVQSSEKSKKEVRIGLLGASGYTGAEIVRLLANHPYFGITLMTADRKAGQSMGSVFPHLITRDLPTLVSVKDADFSKVDAVFCCLPHGTTQEIIKGLPRHLKIVDLSADFRLRDIAEYEEWYGQPHSAPDLQKEAVYGLTEILREEVKSARLVANPGCYPTSIQLPLVPLIKAKLIEHRNIIIDSKSGVSGAGRGAKEANLYSEIAEGIYSYGVTRHRHAPEIEQGLSDAAQSKVTVSFTPHLMPMIRGMQSTIYVEMSQGVTVEDLYQQLRKYYQGEEFVKLLDKGVVPRTHNVRGSNYCFMNVFPDRIPGRAIIISVIDNLVKGASGGYEAELLNGKSFPTILKVS